ncbi:hypothetical protein M3936_09475 [Sutcliffiella horikoshii]|uniref:hypothetical protein n=1 Tax=Sutcliffiella horikoshii TaxID=79883 RepID=UPI000A626AB4|nr:hypothetical protein [Sutcliffiella horikoshii]MCM3617807.1 hypothetical protein [Sutcliffiella horikoshii]
MFIFSIEKFNALLETLFYVLAGWFQVITTEAKNHPKSIKDEYTEDIVVQG